MSVSSGQIFARTNSFIQSSLAWNSGSVAKSHVIGGEAYRTVRRLSDFPLIGVGAPMESGTLQVWHSSTSTG